MHGLHQDRRHAGGDRLNGRPRQPAKPGPGRSFAAELALVVPPTLTVLVLFAFTGAVAHRRLLFASLAASAFLIYRAPLHPMNGVRVMVCAHAVGAATGTAAGLLLGPGYAAAGAAMAACAVILAGL